MKVKMDNDLTKTAQTWLQSKAGKDKLSQAFEEVKQMSYALEKARELKPESLYEPVTL
ncbi:hypothetical protein [Methylotenera versatilis]|uniref:hypothetical protein n=1 Tax=Methylotenera versatilis TaxID=1055487 RepID=UPI000B1B419C|nr:hypothetical protein [Methylotenera versatilis]